MKKVSRFVTICLMLTFIITLVLSFTSNSYAKTDKKKSESSESSVSSSDMFDVMKDVNTPAEDEKVQGVINTIIGLLQVAGTGIALITITMMGLKYIMASPGEKADVKKQVIPIIIGCILLFGAVTLMSAIYDFAQKVLE